MRFLVMSVLLIFTCPMYGMQLSDKFDTKLTMRQYELIPYKEIEPEQVKIPPLEKRLHAHADVIIIGAVIIYGIHTVLTNSSYPPFSYFDWQ